MTPAQFVAALASLYQIPQGIPDEKAFLRHYHEAASEAPHDKVREQAFRLLSRNHGSTFFPSIAECRTWLNRAHVSPEYRVVIPEQDRKMLAAGDEPVALPPAQDRTADRRQRVDEMVKSTVSDVKETAKRIAPKPPKPRSTTWQDMGAPRPSLRTDYLEGKVK